MGRTAKPGQQAPGSPGEFLARWSRRKIESGDEAAQPVEPDAVVAPLPESEADEPQARQPEQELTDADMPPVATLNADSDYAPFMSPGVSDSLRQQALRILFNQPACNITDGLNDYDDDYTQFSGLGSVVTHEMKRMLKRELEAEKDRLEQADARAHESPSADAHMPVDAPVDSVLEPAQSAASAPLDTEADTDNDAADKA